MLEEQIRRFKLGKKISEEAFHNYLRPNNPLYSPEVHETRVDGINPRTDAWEGFGYLVGVLGNSIKHPIAMYRIFSKKD